MNRVRQIAFCGTVIATALTPLTGCGNAGYGESVSVPQQRRTTIDNGFSAGDILSLPGDAVFNVADAQRQSTGDGISDSFADPRGQARCEVSVADIGTAQAEFQLGQVIYNRSAEPVSATVTFDCSFACAVKGDGATMSGDDLIGLKLYVQDSDRRILHRVTLAGGPDTIGAGTRVGRESPSFTFTLEPGLSYSLVAAGKVEIPEGADFVPLTVNLAIDALKIELLAR